MIVDFYPESTIKRDVCRKGSLFLRFSNEDMSIGKAFLMLHKQNEGFLCLYPGGGLQISGFARCWRVVIIVIHELEFRMLLYFVYHSTNYCY